MDVGNLMSGTNPVMAQLAALLASQTNQSSQQGGPTFQQQGATLQQLGYLLSLQQQLNNTQNQQNNGNGGSGGQFRVGGGRGAVATTGGNFGPY